MKNKLEGIKNSAEEYLISKIEETASEGSQNTVTEAETASNTDVKEKAKKGAVRRSKTDKKGTSEVLQTVIEKGKRERKTHRCELLLKPSLYNKLKEFSKEHDISVNEVVCLLIENAFNKEDK